MIRFDEERTVRWIDDVNASSLRRAIDALDAIENPNSKKPIHLIVSSNGGDMSSGFAFYDYVRSIKKIHLTSVGLGEIKSMGVIVFLTGTRRWITPKTLFIFHQGFQPYKGSPNISLHELRNDLETLEREERYYASIVAEATGRTPDETIQWSEEGRVFTAEKAVKFGLAHKIVK